jgi:hypothetical protein
VDELSCLEENLLALVTCELRLKARRNLKSPGGMFGVACGHGADDSIGIGIVDGHSSLGIHFFAANAHVFRDHDLSLVYAVAANEERIKISQMFWKVTGFAIDDDGNGLFGKPAVGPQGLGEAREIMLGAAGAENL